MNLVKKVAGDQTRLLEMQETLHKRTVYSSSHVLGQRKQMASEQPVFKSARTLTILKWLDLPERGGKSLSVKSKDSGGGKHHTATYGTHLNRCM